MNERALSTAVHPQADTAGSNAAPFSDVCHSSPIKACNCALIPPRPSRTSDSEICTTALGSNNCGGSARHIGAALPSQEGENVPKGRSKMIRLIAVAGFALAVATSAQAITPAPIAQSDGMITHSPRMRPRQDNGRWPVRGQNHHPPDPPGRPQVRPWNDLLNHGISLHAGSRRSAG